MNSSVLEVLESLLDDILLPLAVALFVSMIQGFEFVPLSVFLCCCRVMGKLYIKWATFLVKPARQVSAPFLVPMPALTLVTVLIPGLDIRTVGNIFAHYLVYVLYSGAMIVVLPALHLLLFGPRSLPDEEE